METRNVDNEVLVLYDKLHDLYLDSIRFHDACPINEGDEYISKLYNIMDSVNKCMTEIMFGGMGLIDFMDDVNLNELYASVFLIASEVQNAAAGNTNNNAYLNELLYKIHNDTNAIYAIVQGIMQVLLEVFNQ